MTNNTIGSLHTTVTTQGDNTIVTYHTTAVVNFNSDFITLNTGGYKTATTKKRMNQTASLFNLGYQVYQKNKVFYVDYKDNTYTFYGNIVTLAR